MESKPVNQNSGVALDLMEIAVQPEWKQILTDIVHKEKMNPWDIDISLLTSSFLGKIRKMRELDFRIPANAVLASSILLRYKSDAWLLRETTDSEQLVWIPNQLITEPIIPDLEPISRITKRKVSLEELIAAVEDAIKKEKKKARKTRTRTSIPESLLKLVEETEDFDKRLEEVFEKVSKSMDKDNMMLFSQLLKEKTVDEMINYFVPVLHLANKQRLHVWQERIFGDIFIYVPENGEGPPISKPEKPERPGKKKRKPKKKGKK